MDKNMICIILEFIILGAVLGCWILIPWGWTDLVSLAIGAVAFAAVEKVRMMY